MDGMVDQSLMDIWSLVINCGEIAKTRIQPSRLIAKTFKQVSVHITYLSIQVLIISVHNLDSKISSAT